MQTFVKITVTIFLWLLFSLDCFVTSDNDDQTYYYYEFDSEAEFVIDPQGYIVFSPSIGRFGQQVDHLLGALSFAKSINRTFVIPHWTEYVTYESRPHHVPFSAYFEPKSIQSYHRSISMNAFVEQVAPKVWPPEKRVAFCYMERGTGNGCSASDGEAFGQFWDKFGIDFMESEVFGSDLNLITNETGYRDWNRKYPANNWPVLAFVGPPITFPMQQKVAALQKFMVWNEVISQQASDFIATLPKGPFIGVHMRNGPDWFKVCELVDENEDNDLFSSPQCTGYDSENRTGKLTHEMCLPTMEKMVRQLKRAVDRTGAESVFISSDRHLATVFFKSNFKQVSPNVSIHTFRAKTRPHLELAILGRSQLFIGNCVSSFSAFVKRERDIHGLATEFWAFPPEPIVVMPFMDNHIVKSKIEL